MKTNLQVKLFAFVIAASMIGLQLRAADGIAQRAMEAEKHPHLHDTDSTQTGIKAPPGKLIHPVVQSSNVPTMPVPRVRPQQADYHIQQMY